MTADQLILWYYSTNEAFGAPAMNFIDSTGRIYDTACCFCEHKVRQTITDGTWVCANHHCGKPWHFIDAYIFKGEVQQPPNSDTFADRLSNWLDIGTVLYKYLNEYGTCARVYVAYARGFQIAEISAAHSPGLWLTEPGCGWSPRTVYRRKEEGRAEWIRRISDAGISFDP